MNTKYRDGLNSCQVSFIFEEVMLLPSPSCLLRKLLRGLFISKTNFALVRRSKGQVEMQSELSFLSETS